jgi:hypothetical protein
MIEGQPNERAHLLRARVVPYSCDDLQDYGIPKVEPLNEGMNTRGVGGSLGVPIASIYCTLTFLALVLCPLSTLRSRHLLAE